MRETDFLLHLYRAKRKNHNLRQPPLRKKRAACRRSRYLLRRSPSDPVSDFAFYGIRVRPVDAAIILIGGDTDVSLFDPEFRKQLVHGGICHDAVFALSHFRRYVGNADCKRYSIASFRIVLRAAEAVSAVDRFF